MVENIGAETASSLVGNMSELERRRESKDGITVPRPWRAGQRRPDVPQSQTSSLALRRKVLDELSHVEGVVLGQVCGPCRALEVEALRIPRGGS